MMVFHLCRDNKKNLTPLIATGNCAVDIPFKIQKIVKSDQPEGLSGVGERSRHWSTGTGGGTD